MSSFMCVDFVLYDTFHNYVLFPQFDGILPKGPYPPCLRMADRPFWQDTLELWSQDHPQVWDMWDMRCPSLFFIGQYFTAYYIALYFTM